MDFNYLTAPCGIDCFSCEYFHKNIDSDLKKKLMESINCSNVGCMGCRSEDGCRYFKDACEVLKCVNSKGHYFCCECKSFPCERYGSASGKYGRDSLETKIYSLCYMKNHGVTPYLRKRVSIRRKRILLDGKFFVERGQMRRKKR